MLMFKVHGKYFKYYCDFNFLTLGFEEMQYNLEHFQQFHLTLESAYAKF